MDAKALLRRYIEQRRELGESELVLDRLNVEEVMRLLGAAGNRPVSVPRQPSLRETPPSESTDWRSSLRESGVNVEAPPPSVQHQAVAATAPPPATIEAADDAAEDIEADDLPPTTDYELPDD
ncbi:MAG TPA: hypothetical protein VGO75_01725, partial [Gemmatimonadaceae bacterium]|nr:hypothetical protein [Gemmatimonadaceae bacterium]